MCPTFKYNKTYQNWKYLNDPDVAAIDCDIDRVEVAIRGIVEFASGLNSLIVLDDHATSESKKKRTSELFKLEFFGRHRGFSTIVISQQLTSVAKPYREQISKIASFLIPMQKTKTLFLKSACNT